VIEFNRGHAPLSVTLLSQPRRTTQNSQKPQNDVALRVPRFLR
jgi:hypothetical protein